MFKSTWDNNKIKEGFDRFIRENGRLPTAREIDLIDYLPTSRTIQRTFGGLEKLRQELGYQTLHFGKGPIRSEAAREIHKRAMLAEGELYLTLINKFGPMFVHSEKPFGSSSKQRLDFYVYSPKGNFGVDVFYPKDRGSMAGSINIKAVSYKAFQETLFMVVANKTVAQDQIDLIVKNRKNQLNKNVKVLNVNSFLAIIQHYNHYIPIPSEGTV